LGTDLATMNLRRMACRALLALAAGIAPLAAMAQSATPVSPQSGFDLRGATLEGKPFNLADLRGKVVMVFFWSTDCAVCRSKMPELRANAEGWRGKPFELVLVSLDRRRADLIEYDRLLAATQANAVHFRSLWSGDPGYSDTLPQRPRQLPLTLLIDVQGRLAARFEGRIPAEAWDSVADLMP
jgi:thiol-disulfide isomerase/thioredoxin